MFLVFNTCFSCFFFISHLQNVYFNNAQLLYERLESCPNVVDVRIMFCLFELMNY